MESRARRALRWIVVVVALGLFVADYVTDRLGADWKQNHSKEEVGLALADFIATFGLGIGAVLLLIAAASFGSELRRRRQARQQPHKQPRR